MKLPFLLFEFHLFQNLFHPAHNPTRQFDFDAVGMIGRFRQDSLNGSFGEFSCSLMVFLDHSHFGTDLDIFSVSMWHVATDVFCFL